MTVVGQIVYVKERQAYGLDDTYHTVYDYIYEYEDFKGKLHRRKIVKFSPKDDFLIGTKIHLRYAKLFPFFSVIDTEYDSCKRFYSTIFYMSIVIAIVLYWFIFILF